MNEKNELIRLTLKNLETVETAYKILEEKNLDFIRQIDKFMENNLFEIFPDWEIHCQFENEDDLSFWSKSWILPNEEGYAYYAIGLISDPNEASWITCFARKLEGIIGIGFNVDKAIHGSNRKEWCSKLTKFYKENEIIFNKANFVFNGEQIYRPIQLDLELLADSYPDYIGGGVFEPLKQAINDIKSVHHIFDEFVMSLIKNKE